MTRKFIICDDDLQIHRQLSDYLNQFFNGTNEEFDTLHFDNADDLLNNEYNSADILFLDIGMNGKTGMEAARNLRARGCDSFIVFVTSMPEYALDGYEVNAYGFLVKPVIYSHFRNTLERILKIIDTRKSAVIPINFGAETKVIPVDDIIYAEVLQHVTTIVTSSGEFEYPITLTEIEEKTLKHGFFRCHKSFLINMKHVESVKNNELVMKNKISIPLSKYRRREFLKAYSMYVGSDL